VEAKELMADVFPGARIGAIMAPEETPCAGCGIMDSTMSVTLESGNRYCGACYSGLTGPWPIIDRYGRKTVRER